VIKDIIRKFLNKNVAAGFELLHGPLCREMLYSEKPKKINILAQNKINNHK
jgi:outer membrane PBP1 activator LpoA protein